MAYALYGDKGSGAFCVEAALAEAGADYEFKTVSLRNMEQKSADFLAINPSGKMPALKLSTGEILTESLALLLTIAERHPEAKLLPQPATVERAQALRWLAFMASEIYPIVEIIDYPERFSQTDSEGVKANAQARIRERNLIVENAIVGPWLLGPAFSLADIYASMFSRWDVAAEWREKNLPKLSALAGRLSQRPKIAPVWQRHFGG